MKQKVSKKIKGFTLLEILLVIAAIGILAAIVLVAINPNRQIAQVRNAERRSDVNTLYKALEQYLIENRSYPVGITNTYKEICNTGSNNNIQGTVSNECIDLRELVPTYIASIPVNPSTSTHSGYYAWINDINKKLSVLAGKGENGKVIGINHLKENIVTDGLVLHLDAGNLASYPGTGNTWFDLSGNGNNGTLEPTSGFPTYSSDNGGSLVFNGGGHYVSTPVTGTFTQISFDYWGFYDDPSLNTKLRNESAFGDWTNGRIHWGTRWSVGMHWNVNGSWVEIPNTNLRSGWNHFSLIWNNSTSQKLVYINNQLSSTQTTNGNITLGEFRIGGATNLNAYYRGQMTHFKIYNRALTASEIEQNYNATRSRFVL